MLSDQECQDCKTRREQPIPQIESQQLKVYKFYDVKDDQCGVCRRPSCQWPIIVGSDGQKLCVSQKTFSPSSAMLRNASDGQKFDKIFNCI